MSAETGEVQPKKLLGSHAREPLFEPEDEEDADKEQEDVMEKGREKQREGERKIFFPLAYSENV